MVNPVLKKIRRAHLSAEQISSLLKQHVGDGLNEVHCVQALEVVSRSHDARLSKAKEALDLLLPVASPCEKVNALVLHLQGAAWEK